MIGYYNTAACLWLEVYRRGGFAALRRVLASMRANTPPTTGHFVVQHLSVVLRTDLRPVLRRYGFTDAELTAPPPPEPVTRLAVAPRRPRAGQRVTARLVLERNGGAAIGGRVRCTAQLGRRSLAVVARGMLGVVLLPLATIARSSRRVVSRGTIVVQLEGERVSRSFMRRLR